MAARATTRLDGFDTETWRHPDGSGRTLERHLVAAAPLDHEPTAADRRRLAQVPVRETSYPFGSLPVPLKDAIPADVAALAADIAYFQPPENGPIGVIAGLADIATLAAPDREQRATILRLLATVRGITVNEHDRDAAGWAGVTIGLSYGGVSRWLTFEPHTGELLAYRDHTRSGVRPGLFAYHLYLARAYTTSGRQRPAFDPAPATSDQRRQGGHTT